MAMVRNKRRIVSTTLIDLRECLESFFDYWGKCDAISALKQCQLTWINNTREPLQRIRYLIVGLELKEYDIKEIKMITPVSAECEVSINKGKPAFINLIKEIAPYQPSEKGQWGINPISVLKLI